MIEITRKGEYIYKLNKWNPRIIDRRKNKAYARFKPFAGYATQTEALAALLKLERNDAEAK